MKPNNIFEVLLLILIVFLITFVLHIDIESEQEKCALIEMHSTVTVEWRPWGGCYVQTFDGYWIRDEQFLKGE